MTTKKERLAQLLREYPTWADAALDLQDKLFECRELLQEWHEATDSVPFALTTIMSLRVKTTKLLKEANVDG